MRLTEQLLWKRLAKEVRGLDLLTRIETGGTHAGVSDTEYVIHPWHGWMELKVATAKRESSLLGLKTPFTYDQYQWLLRHHRPSCFLFSWLVIGRPGGEWLMLSAPASALIAQRKIKLQKVREIRGLITCRSAAEVVQTLKR